MVLRKNNKGFSLVEMMVAVTILSIVMMGIVGILASMSKSFGNSQREVELQDSVQATYSIVSELIKEAQSADNAVSAVEFDSSKNRAYIIVDNTTNPAESEYYIIEYLPSRNNMYLYRADLYEDVSTMTKVDYKAKSSTAVCTAQNLLATNVSSFDVNTDKLSSGGYVVLGLECAYGSREASLTQNVYLRNSNMSAEWMDTIEEEPETDELAGYTLTAISSITCEKNPYAVGATPVKKDFVIMGTYTNDENSEDVKSAQVPSSAFESPQLGVQLTTAGSVNIEFSFTGTTLTETFAISVNAGTSGITLVEEGMAEPEKSDISQSGDIRAYYSAKSSGESGLGTVSKQVTTHVPEGDVCASCGGSVTYIVESWGATRYKCNADGSDPGCQGQYYQTTVTHVDAHDVTTTNTYYVGSGKVSVINESTTTDFSNVVVRLYFENDNTMFYNKGTGFLTVDASNTTGNQQLTYAITGALSNGITDYIEIRIPYMPKGSEEDGFATYTFNYYWASADSSITADSVVSMAVYSVDFD